MMYYVDKPMSEPCGYFALIQGCYTEERCYGVSHVRISGGGAPTSMPSGQPSTIPTAEPSSPSSVPSGQPSNAPSGEPSSPSGEPSGQPSDQPSTAPSAQPSDCPTSRPSMDNSTSPPSFQPTPGPKPNMQTTLLIAIGTPASVLLLLVVARLMYRYVQERYSVYLDVTARVSCLPPHTRMHTGVSSLKYHHDDFDNDFDDLDLFEDGDFQDLCQGREN